MDNAETNLIKKQKGGDVLSGEKGGNMLCQTLKEQAFKMNNNFHFGH